MNETPCRREGQIVNLPVINTKSWKTLPNGVLLYPLQPPTKYVTYRSILYLFCLFLKHQQQQGFAKYCCIGCTDFAGGRMTLQTASLQISRGGEILQKYYRAWVSRESACILESRSVLLTLHPILVLLSYLAHVCCGAVRTTSKDWDIPYPFSRDYEYLEDYLHWQMKEWVCGHASKRLLNDKCENWIRPYWETSSLTSRKVPFTLLYLGLGYVL